MIYEGPKILRQGIATTFEGLVKPVTTRKDRPLIIVGGIESITMEGDKLVIRGDREKNKEIDEVWQSIVRNPSEIAATCLDVIKAGEEGNARELEGTRPIVGLYNPHLDAMMLSAEAVAISKVGQVVLRVGLSDDRSYKAKIAYIEKNFPHALAEIFMRREFGDTNYNREMQQAMLEGRPVFDKGRQWQYSFVKVQFEGKKSREEYTREDIKQEKEALGIQDLEKAAASIGARLINHERPKPIKASDNATVRMLKEKAAQGTTHEFIAYAKDVAEKAYETRKPVRELIPQKV